MKKKKSEEIIDVFAPVITLILLIVLLEFVIDVFKIPRQILPTPRSILSAGLKYFFSDIFYHFKITILVIGIGFVIGVPVGIILAAFLSQYKIIERAFSPFVILWVTTPLITLVPLFKMWLGFGLLPRLLVVIMQTIPIVMLNSITGFNNIERSKLNIASSMGATRIQTFFKIIFPNALPQVFTGIKLGGIFATIATIGAELSGEKTGLGSRIFYFTRLIETEIAFSCIFLVAIIGIALFIGVTIVEKKIVVWKK